MELVGISLYPTSTGPREEIREMNCSKRVLRLVVMGFSVSFLWQCSKDSGGSAAGLICSVLNNSTNSNALTVGFGADFLDSLRLRLGLREQFLSQDDQDQLNAGIKDSINSAFQAASLDRLISVAAVSSIPKAKGEDDGVRFLELGGSIGSGVGFASKLLKNQKVLDALSMNLNLQGQDSALSFVEDSFNVFVTSQPAQLLEAGGFNKQQWAYQQTDLDSAQEDFDSIDNKKDQVIVAVIDTGVDYEHKALADSFYRKEGNIVGYDFVSNDNIADDDQGHGTHCAGIIAGKKVSDQGMIGVAELLAPNKVRIMPIKVLGADGSGSTDAINKGIRWAMQNGADVISMSLGGGVDFSSIKDSNGTESPIIRDAIEAGIILVVAAGNEGCPLGGECEKKSLFVLSQKINEYTVLPCSYNGTICVGASDSDATLASYSNYPSDTIRKGVDPDTTARDNKRTSTDISAPGTSIYSTYPDNQYKLLSGTSMATPYVAGLAALYKLKLSEQAQQLKGSPQRSFRDILQASELALETEGAETRNFIGQVDLAYFIKQLKAIDNNSEAAVAAPENLKKIEDPEESKQPSDSSDSEKVPNLLSQVCGF